MSNVSLVDTAVATALKIGVDKTIEVLKAAQYQHIQIEDSRANFIVDIVSRYMPIPAHEIMFGNGRNNDRKYAIGLCAHYLHSEKYYNIPMEEVAVMLQKKSNACYIYAKEIDKLNPRIHHNAKLITIKETLDAMVLADLKNRK